MLIGLDCSVCQWQCGPWCRTIHLTAEERKEIKKIAKIYGIKKKKPSGTTDVCYEPNRKNRFGSIRFASGSDTIRFGSVRPTFFKSWFGSVRFRPLMWTHRFMTQSKENFLSDFVFCYHLSFSFLFLVFIHSVMLISYLLFRNMSSKAQ